MVEEKHSHAGGKQREDDDVGGHMIANVREQKEAQSAQQHAQSQEKAPNTLSSAHGDSSLDCWTSLK
jgi:hypothetical protein